MGFWDEYGGLVAVVAITAVVMTGIICGCNMSIRMKQLAFEHGYEETTLPGARGALWVKVEDR